MRRIFPEYTYGEGPRADCWWTETIATPQWPLHKGEVETDVAIVGGGFTGISAALHLATSGLQAAVFEAKTPGWGASGRNGGFCCLGGSKLTASQMVRKFGQAAADTYSQCEIEAVNLVQSLINDHGIEADTHSDGETILAHSSKMMTALRDTSADLNQGGFEHALIEQADLSRQGMNGPFYGALNIPIGFGLNPLKYLFGISNAAQSAKAQLYSQSPITGVSRVGSEYILTTPNGRARAKHVIIATNGYSWDGLPDWMRGRYMPTQSSVMVTRPLTQSELDAQGWFTDQMAYDTRNLLHYFRLMPDRRFLFGMRGGLISSEKNDKRIYAALKQHFKDMFPAWSGVEVTHCWSGLVCLTRSFMPFVGEVPDQPNMYAGFGYHGNGVAMGSYAGRLLADRVLRRETDLPYPDPFKMTGTFPLGSARRLLLPPAYALLALQDFKA